MPAFRLVLFVLFVGLVALSSVRTPEHARAEATGQIIIGCEFLASRIDGDLSDATVGGDFAAACDGLTEAELDLIDEVLGDKDEQLEPSDFAEIDLDENQIQDNGVSPFYIGTTYSIAFLDDDGIVRFDAGDGVTVVVSSGGNEIGTNDGDFETCDPGDDLDCDDSLQSENDGDGIAVATITDGTAIAGDTVDVDVFQADDIGSVFSQTINVMSYADDVSLSIATKSVIQTSLDAFDCVDESDVTSSAQLTDVNKTLVRAVVTDVAGNELARVPVFFEGDASDTAIVGEDAGEDADDPKATTGVSVALGGGLIGAEAVVCGGEEPGTGLVTATIDPDGVPGSADDEASSVQISVVGPSAAIELEASPVQLVCDGVNTSTITATIRDSAGDLVADGTHVNFSVTSVGVVNPINTTTTNGVATTTFRGFAASSVGVPVIVTSGNAQSSILIECIGFDTDGDGMPNVFEAGRACLDPNAPDSSADQDSDVLSSLTEYRSALEPCVADTDIDGCEDGAEVTGSAQSGGDRDPLDHWDFYDVTGDRAIDLQDALAILDKFGRLPGDDGYDAALDRMAPDALKPWRTAPATGGAIGIDLQDALLNLQSFGHACVN